MTGPLSLARPEHREERVGQRSGGRRRHRVGEALQVVMYRCQERAGLFGDGRPQAPGQRQPQRPEMRLDRLGLLIKFKTVEQDAGRCDPPLPVPDDGGGRLADKPSRT